MSTTSVLEVQGEPFSYEKFLPTLSPDPQYISISQDGVKALPKGRIQWLRDEEQGTFSVWSIDAAVQVRTPSDIFRERQVEKWTILQKDMQNTYWHCNAAAALCLLVVVVIRRYFFKNSPAPATTSLIPFYMISSSIIGLFGGFGIAYLQKSRKASREINIWSSSPAQEVLELRNIAYQQGFPFVYFYNLKIEGESSKSGFFHPLEVQAMYQKYCKDFCNKLLSRDEIDEEGRFQWLKDFLEYNPLFSQPMRYGLGIIPENLKAIVEECERLSFLIKKLKDSDSQVIEHCYFSTRKLLEEMQEKMFSNYC